MKKYPSVNIEKYSRILKIIQSFINFANIKHFILVAFSLGFVSSKPIVPLIPPSL